MLMNAVLWRLLQRNSKATPNAISFVGFQDGRSPSPLPDGPKTAPSGQPVCPANPSPRRASKPEPRTTATSGPSLNASFGSAALQQSLESKWRARLQGINGSPEYVWTLKHWDIPSRGQIFALRSRARSAKDGLCVAIRRLGNESSSEHPTSGSGYTGSPIEGWATPSAQGSAGEISEDLVRVGKKWVNSKTGRVLQTNLATDVRQLVPTPMAGWPTPIASANCETHDAAMKELDRSANRSDGGCSKLAVMAHIPFSGYPTAAARDWKDVGNLENSRFRQDGKERNDTLPRVASMFSSPAATAKPAALNPAFSRWLMGYPVEWCQAAIRATRSMPTRQRKRGQ
jgi:hypothetical protein